MENAYVDKDEVKAEDVMGKKLSVGGDDKSPYTMDVSGKPPTSQSSSDLPRAKERNISSAKPRLRGASQNNSSTNTNTAGIKISHSQS
jgi:hypothetical protein